MSFYYKFSYCYLRPWRLIRGSIFQKNSLPFAVWNLDSLPARDFSRIPLIETFETTYDFGVCESTLKIFEMQIFFINSFSPDHFRFPSYSHPNMPINEFAEYMRLLENIYEYIRKENPIVSILCGGLPCFGNVTLKIMSDVHLITF